jgi:hypothetical protein
VQLLSVTQPQIAELTTQIGVPGFPLQAVAFVAEHCVHSPTNWLPCGWQAGSIAVGHDWGPGGWV